MSQVLDDWCWSWRAHLRTMRMHISISLDADEWEIRLIGLISHVQIDWFLDYSSLLSLHCICPFTSSTLITFLNHSLNFDSSNTSISPWIIEYSHMINEESINIHLMCWKDHWCVWNISISLGMISHRFVIGSFTFHLSILSTSTTIDWMDCGETHQHASTSRYWMLPSTNSLTCHHRFDSWPTSMSWMFTTTNSLTCHHRLDPWPTSITWMFPTTKSLTCHHRLDPWPTSITWMFPTTNSLTCHHRFDPWPTLRGSTSPTTSSMQDSKNQTSSTRSNPLNSSLIGICILIMDER